MFRKQLRLTNRFYIFALILMVALFIVGEVRLNNKTAQAAETLASYQDSNTALTNKLLQLEQDLAFAKSEEGIELFARENGLQKKGETRYSIK